MEQGIEKGMEQGIEKGIEQGVLIGSAKGEDKMGRLACALINQGRSGEVEKAAADAAYRKQLYCEFGL